MEPVPVTLPPTARGEEGTRAVLPSGGMETATGAEGARASGLISTVWGIVDRMRGGLGAEGGGPGTAEMASASTSSEETLVTVPDCTVRPGAEVGVPSLEEAASAGSWAGAAVTVGGATELELLGE